MNLRSFAMGCLAGSLSTTAVFILLLLIAAGA